jgi:hypothetical protein
MSVALQVEKTSKRGGRIIHEKDGNVMPPPAFAMPSLSGSGNRFALLFGLSTSSALRRKSLICACCQ